MKTQLITYIKSHHGSRLPTGKLDSCEDPTTGTGDGGSMPGEQCKQILLCLLIPTGESEVSLPADKAKPPKSPPLTLPPFSFSAHHRRCVDGGGHQLQVLGSSLAVILVFVPINDVIDVRGGQMGVDPFGGEGPTASQWGVRTAEPRNFPPRKIRVHF